MSKRKRTGATTFYPTGPKPRRSSSSNGISGDELIAVGSIAAAVAWGFIASNWTAITTFLGVQ